MFQITERHSVEITQGSSRYLVATADLCSDTETVETLRNRVLLIGGASIRISDRAGLGRAFDEAFNSCEARPGNDVSAVFDFADGQITVSRKYAA
ncbi:hypothetical protein [Sphingomonas sp. 3-13AW]|uniref:hypothetical protein n=1 Tax=Sphingomonas sp. 3-13AW TaxID=3050450 RepID=UPI003BB7730E